MDERDIARFWLKVDRTTPDACWPWVAGNRGRRGYGRFSMGRKNRCIRAHRFSWEIVNGPIPSGIDVLHSCDNTVCCNPRHLFLGTNLDNVRDMHAKNRHSHGEKHGQAKLTDERVRNMRALRAERRYSYQRLADLFSVSLNCAWGVCNRTRWKHVT